VRVDISLRSAFMTGDGVTDGELLVPGRGWLHKGPGFSSTSPERAIRIVIRTPLDAESFKPDERLQFSRPVVLALSQ
jgi:hypothetical protein